MAKVAEQQPTSSSTGATATNELQLMDAYWRACNYLSAGMIYLRENPLLRQPLKVEHIKNRLLGHWVLILGKALPGFISIA